jgi:hypothetical protein
MIGPGCRCLAHRLPFVSAALLRTLLDDSDSGFDRASTVAQLTPEVADIGMGMTADCIPCLFRRTIGERRFGEQPVERAAGGFLASADEIGKVNSTTS